MNPEAGSSRGHTVGALSYGLRSTLSASIGLSAKKPPGSCHGAGRSSCPGIRKRYVTVPCPEKAKILAKVSDSQRIRPLFGQVAVCSYQRSDLYVIPHAGYIFAFLGTVVS